MTDVGGMFAGEPDDPPKNIGHEEKVEFCQVKDWFITKKVNYRVKIDDLKDAFPKTKTINLKKLTTVLNKYMEDFGIDNNLKLAHFLAQGAAEVSQFNKAYAEENLNYSVKGLICTFSRFVGDKRKSDQNKNLFFADDYGRKEGQKAKKKEIGNIAYYNRIGNGDLSSGDGYEYRGRGIFQLTGKYNYEQFTKYYQKNYDKEMDFVKNPELLCTDYEITVLSALWFFKNNVMKKLSINKNTTSNQVTAIVNKNTNSYLKREKYFKKIIKVLD
ncbi:MAG: glycoside hydrolase family 19 protein [Bacteroidales bacterium]